MRIKSIWLVNPGTELQDLPLPKLGHRGDRPVGGGLFHQRTPTTGGVPPVAAGGPGKFGAEGGEEVDEGPGQHYDVVDVEEEADGHGSNANSGKKGTDGPPDGNAPGAEVLPNADLHEEDGQGAKGEEEKVGNEEGA